MSRWFSPDLKALCATAESVAQGAVRPNAEEVDATCSWPAASLAALAEAGLMGVPVPARLGGHGQGLLSVAAVTEILGKACSSTALCYGMHCVGTAVIAANATRSQEERYLSSIAAGRHITTIALSEGGSGANLFIPEMRSHRDGDAFVLNGAKKFVTSGGHADSYVLSTLSSGETAPGEFDCVVIDAGTHGMHWSQPWRGFGMRGNASRELRLENARVPAENLLGAEGEQPWYVFQIIIPYFLMAMGGTYLGIAQAALDLAIEHVGSRHHSHSGRSLGELETVQHRIGELWTAVERSRLLLYEAAALADSGERGPTAAAFACKADVAETVVRVTNEAMSLCGGTAYAENARLARLLRDARASHVMAPTTEMLKAWTGRMLLGLPLL